MQLAAMTLVFVLIFFVNEVKAQIKNTALASTKDKVFNDSIRVETKVIENTDWKTVDVNFLSSYYQQDGNNGAVTGGIGTEFLTDFTQKLLSLLLSQKSSS